MKKFLLPIVIFIFPAWLNAAGIEVSWNQCSDCTGYKLELERKDRGLVNRILGIDKKRTVITGVVDRYLFEDVHRGVWKVSISALSGNISSEPAVEEISVPK